MEPFVRGFLKASLTWLSLGVTLGVVMAAVPSLSVYRPAHLHMLTLGFVAMMIFGVAYHVIPRFSGHPLHSRILPVWHWWMSNVGLLLMSVGFVLRQSMGARATPLLAIGAALSAIGAYVFAFVMWRTLGAGTSVTPARSTEAITLRRVK
jgi:heme/copper-type cytochrome/quinol oxidase subunit 1